KNVSFSGCCVWATYAHSPRESPKRRTRNAEGLRGSTPKSIRLRLSPAIFLRQFLQFCEIARVLVRLDHVVNIIVHSKHSIMGAGVLLSIADCVAHSARPVIPQATERQHVTD